MTVYTEKFTISSNGFDDLIDITSKVQNIVLNANVENAIVNISTAVSTASIITLEQQEGLAFDFASIMENIIPLNKIYKHDLSWHEGNAHAHLRAALLGSNITLSVIDKKIVIDKFQKIVFIDFDTKTGMRQIIVSVVY